MPEYPQSPRPLLEIMTHYPRPSRRAALPAAPPAFPAARSPSPLRSSPGRFACRHRCSSGCGWTAVTGCRSGDH